MAVRVFALRHKGGCCIQQLGRASHRPINCNAITMLHGNMGVEEYQNSIQSMFQSRKSCLSTMLCT